MDSTIKGECAEKYSKKKMKKCLDNLNLLYWKEIDFLEELKKECNANYYKERLMQELLKEEEGNIDCSKILALALTLYYNEVEYGNKINPCDMFNFVNSAKCCELDKIIKEYFIS